MDTAMSADNREKIERIASQQQSISHHDEIADKLMSQIEEITLTMEGTTGCQKNVRNTIKDGLDEMKEAV